MAAPQFNSAEEFQAYLAGVNQQNLRTESSRTNVKLWKLIPAIVGFFVVGFVLAINYPAMSGSGDDSKVNSRISKSRTSAVESFLSWMGADVEGFKSKNLTIPKIEPNDIEFQIPDYSNFGN